MHDEVGTLVRHKSSLLISWESILPHLFPEPQAEASIVLKEEVNNLWARFGNRLWAPVVEYIPRHPPCLHTNDSGVLAKELLLSVPLECWIGHVSDVLQCTSFTCVFIARAV